MPAPLRTLAAGLALVAWAAFPLQSRASESREKTLPAFSVLEIHTAVDLDLRVDPAAGPKAKLRVEADPDDLDRLTLEVKGDRLVVSHDGWHGPRHAVRISGTVPSLEAVEVDGVADGRIAGLSAAQFRVQASGAGDLTLAGKVGTFDVDLSGAARVRAFDLSAQDAKVDVSGAGSVETCASASLDASVSGVGSVEYACNPARVHRDVSGVGSVRARDR